MSLFTIYSSSAGSGKTFTLTKEYLKLILKSSSPLYFQHILAMTFTNDAADEMKKRILKELKLLIHSSDEPSDILQQILKETPELDIETIQKRAGLALHEILQNYNDFAVKTIDSFVNQVVSSFTFDLDLPYNYEIILDTKELIGQAVRRLIDKIGSDEYLTEMFKDFALSKLDENKSWNTLESDIVAFAQVIYVDNNAEQIAKNMGLSHGDIKEIKSKITRYLKDTEASILALGKEAIRLMEAEGLGESDFLYGGAGIYNFYRKMAENPEKLFEEDLFKGRVNDALENDKWYKAKSPNAGVIDSLKERLIAIAYSIQEIKNEKYPILKIIGKDLLKIPFLSKIKEEIDLILKERNEVVLSDFNQKILDVVSREPVPFIFERIGEKYNHLLVDEFQDTSDIQFFNLLPLFDNALAKGQENLIVGDPKQAIYSWRGGNVMLMLDLIAQDGSYLNAKAPEIQQWQISSVVHNTEVKNLSTNYRSFEEVINFNNALFTSMVKAQESVVLNLFFSYYIQNSPSKPKTGGYAEVQVLDKEEDSIEEKLPQLIEQICNDGYALGDIAILCRRGKEGIRIAEILKAKGYKINSSEALKLQNNLEVKFLMSALRFVSHPERQFERFEFLHFFYKVKGIDPSPYDINAICNLSPSEFLEHFKIHNISLEGMEGLQTYALLEFLVDRFSLLQNDQSSPYLFALLDYALDFSNRTSQNLVDFLTAWNLKKEKLSISAQTSDAITIQTIHKSKGLEYRVVIMPYLTWDTKPDNRDNVWLSVDELGFEELTSATAQIHSAPFKYTQHFEFSKDTLENLSNLALIENLNLLYVSLTRAIERQYLWIWEKQNKKGSTLEGIGKIIHGFLQSRENYTSECKKFLFGSADLKIQREKVAEAKAYYEMEWPKPFSQVSKLKLNTSTAPQDERILKGNLIHTAFERIYKESDVERVLEQMLTEKLLTPATVNEVRTKVLSVIQNPELRPLFSETAVVKNEVEILSSHTQVKRPDRVIFIHNEVYIVDYKTGKKSSLHQKQLKEYADLLRQMGYQNIKTKVVYLESM
jgi:ATP-dependent helicase/nuclease subunit A